jgi:ATP-dependent DNA ligase
MPPFTPMEAKVQAELPRGDGWQYEPKWDGFRAVAFKDGDEVVIHSRNQKPLTRYFPELVPALQRIKPKRAVLDGEIVIFTGFGTDFDAMTLRIHPAASRVNMLAAEQPSTYIAFDLLADGDLRNCWAPSRSRST